MVDCAFGGRGKEVVRALRRITAEPVNLIVYTHSHTDHTTGAHAFIEDATARGHSRPEIWAHEGVRVNQGIYANMAGWNAAINSLQFDRPFETEHFRDPQINVAPDFDYRDRHRLSLAGEPVDLFHARAETDDATWVWLPEREVAFVGDLIISSLPNTGNPLKPQRFTLEWAEALEEIVALRPAFVLPGHGPPFHGVLALQVLTDTAAALRFIHDAVVRRLNRGDWPVDIIEASIQLPPSLAEKPWLAELYGCVSFVVRDVLRHYGGWWSGEPSGICPPSRAAHAYDVLRVSGRDAILVQVRRLLAGGKYDRAVALAEYAYVGLPFDVEARLLYATSLRLLARTQRSFITRNLLLGCAKRVMNPG